MQCWAPPANPIMQVEFLAVLVGLLCSWQKLAGRDVIWFIDSTSALAAAIKGSSPGLDVDSMSQLLNILPYVGNIRFWWGLLSAVRSRARVWRQVRPRARVFGCCTRPLGPRPLGARMSRWRTSASASGGGICPRRRALEVRRRPLGRPPAPPVVRVPAFASGFSCSRGVGAACSRRGRVRLLAGQLPSWRSRRVSAVRARAFLGWVCRPGGVRVACRGGAGACVWQLGHLA